MGLPTNVEDVLAGRSVEWERLEFKRGWNPEDVLHSLCAFANDFHNLGGGYLFIGVEEEGGKPVLPPLGLSLGSLDTIQKEILALGHKIQPPYHPIVDPCVVEGRHILILFAPGGQNRPYKAPKSLAKGDRSFGYYIRKGSSTVCARQEEEIELFALAAQVPFDDRMNQNASPSDLNPALLQAHLRRVGSSLCDDKTMNFENLCRRMSIVDGPREGLHPRNAGLMFFNEKPERFFPQTQIDIVQLPDGAGVTRSLKSSSKGLLHNN